MSSARPIYIRVAEALGLPAEVGILEDHELLASLVALNAIHVLLVAPNRWEATTTPDTLFGEVLATGPMKEIAIWGLVLKLKTFGLLRSDQPARRQSDRPSRAEGCWQSTLLDSRA